MKVVVEDKNRIKEVVFKYPHLMSGTAANDIKEEYYDILELEEELDKYRNHVRLLESTILEKKQEFIHKSELFSLVFETKEEEQVDRVTVNGAIINPTDASNKNYGLK